MKTRLLVSTIATGLIVVLLFIVLVGCAPIKPVDPSLATPAVCVRPETDNSQMWALGACVDVSTTVYTVVVRVDSQIVNHSEMNVAGSTYNGTGSFRMWQDGKGILPVILVSINPPFPELEPSDRILIKTSDLKAMALPEGAQTTFICNEDIEVLSPNTTGQVLTTDRLTRELDDCRMLLPSYLISGGE